MGSVHCFTAHRRLKAGHLPEQVPVVAEQLSAKEGVVRDFRKIMPGPCSDEEIISLAAGAIIRYLMEVLSAQNSDVPLRTRFQFFGVFHEGWYQLLVRAGKVVDLRTGKGMPRCFIASALDLYPKPVRMDSEIVKNTSGAPLITIPMSTLYRYNV
jgi:hypothetical protein